jgi:hypothetical protein
MNDDQLELETDNPAEFLRNESGAFEVISPDGQVFFVTCRRGLRMNVRQISETKSVGNLQHMTWKIRRVINTGQSPLIWITAG